MAALLSGLTGWIAVSIDDHEMARSEASHGLVVARRIGAPSLLAGALGMHARAVADDNPDEALAAADESIRLTDDGAGDLAYSAVLSIAATLRADRGDHAGATRAVRTAVAHEARTGNRSVLAAAVTVAAAVLAGPADTSEVAATITGALAGPALGSSRAFLTPLQQNRYQQRLAAVAAALGAAALHRQPNSAAQP